MSTAPADDFIKRETEKYMNAISEHTDSIRIFVTMPDSGGETVSFSMGHGNWFAQYGHIRTWLVSQDVKIRERTLRESDSDENAE